jgi:hypothetical protein
MTDDDRYPFSGPDPDRNPGEEDGDVVEEYPHNCRIVRDDENGYKRYHYEGPMGRVKSFDNPDKARLYADVQTVMSGFREEKTGERGVPPSVARAREDVVMAYLAAQPSMSMEWVARHFDLPEDRVREYIQVLQNRANEERSEQAED